MKIEKRNEREEVPSVSVSLPIYFQQLFPEVEALEALLQKKHLNRAERRTLQRLLKSLLQKWVERRYLSYIDLYFAEFIAQNCQIESPRHWLGYTFILLLLSRAYGYGHTALPIAYLENPKQWFSEVEDPARLSIISGFIALLLGSDSGRKSQDELNESNRLNRWNESNKSSESNEGARLANFWQEVLQSIQLPLVRVEQTLYLDRNYAQENVIIDFFAQQRSISLLDEEVSFLKERLDDYFGVDKSLNWQKFAAANVLLNPLSVISGGPGTGKTTTVFKIAQILVDLHLRQRQLKARKQPFTILLTAPTGKAAARLSESILGQIRTLQHDIATLPEVEEQAVRQQLALIPYSGQTIHRLLRIDPLTRKPHFDRFNPLSFDLLVVDEASMIDQQMMVQLIEALPEKGRVIFLGDKDQLASVEAGAIMHELCARENYSQEHYQQLQRLMSESLEAIPVIPNQAAFNYLSFLKKSYRFSDDSALGALAREINNEGQSAIAEQYRAVDKLFKKVSTPADLQKEEGSLFWSQLPFSTTQLLHYFKEAYHDYLALLPTGRGITFAEKAFKCFNQLGILSARRTGEYGAIALNELIRKTLFPKLYLREFFHGLPIMITHNSIDHQLFNGDIGLILENEEGNLRAYFEGVDSARVFSIHALPKFEPAFAMTIHKSQGSEFQKVMLFLGSDASSFLTKELFYTGVTRARSSVHLFATDEALKAALMGRVDRYSAIHDRLSQKLLTTEVTAKEYS
ncbi:exodeoxyribonuclease V subunit alpha [Ignatzschineria cameli]|uniref:RecBCD enzyme subunit RecD n=1 Tax=Ignatzschineria cameli TaxID=2182793 RepID=A0A2U2ASF1_9GAMM|nr:exodeoxyribonuclease V subunit alpha [Ignatzschineria cameli]PWD86455.1 exodeoxyribonuclease V subunit alpha [Ignatzschineria cameli]PWD87191.1 exodeoxyribonuclease V subunit alpha [Ignatzschineria cameli]